MTAARRRVARQASAWQSAPARIDMEHLSETTVLDFFRAELSSVRHLRVARHIDECSDCRQLVSAISPSRDDEDRGTAHCSSHGIEGVWCPGSLIDHRFEVIDRVAAGGMATVFRARDTQNGASVALKATPKGGAEDDGTRFDREARVLAQLVHPVIVRYVSHGTTPWGDGFLAMEWLVGEDLADRVASGRLAVLDAVRLAERLAQGLAAAHAAGIVHRDIKPRNIRLVDSDVARAMIVDFGIARSGRKVTVGTRPGTLLGTPGYMAPEQARGLGAVDGRADVFSLGCVLYECLTGEPPFVGDGFVEVLAKVILQTPSRVSKLRGEIPPALDALVAGMLAKDPSKRTASAELVAQRLRAIGDDIERGALGLGHHRAARWVGVGVMVVAASAAAVVSAECRWGLPPSQEARASARGGDRGVAAMQPPTRVLVLGIANRTSNPIFDPVLGEIFASALDRSPALIPTGGDSLRRLIQELDPSLDVGDPSLAGRVAAREGRPVVTVSGEIAPKGIGYRVAVTARRATDTGVLGTFAREIDTEAHLVGALGQLASDVRLALGDLLSVPEGAARERTDMSLSLEADYELVTGQSLARDGRDLALTHLQRAVELDPGFAWAHDVLATYQLGEMKRGGVEERSSRRPSRSASGPLRRREASLDCRQPALEMQSNDAEAQQAYEKLLEERPTSFGAQMNLANIYVGRGDYLRAVELERRLAVENIPRRRASGGTSSVMEILDNQIEAAARDAHAFIDSNMRVTPISFVGIGVALASRGRVGGGAHCLPQWRRASAPHGGLCHGGHGGARGQPAASRKQPQRRRSRAPDRGRRRQGRVALRSVVVLGAGSVAAWPRAASAGRAPTATRRGGEAPDTLFDAASVLCRCRACGKGAGAGQAARQSQDGGVALLRDAHSWGGCAGARRRKRGRAPLRGGAAGQRHLGGASRAWPRARGERCARARGGRASRVSGATGPECAGASGCALDALDRGRTLRTRAGHRSAG